MDELTEKDALLSDLADCLEDIVSRYVDVCDANTSEGWDASHEEEVIAAGKLVAEARALVPSPPLREE